MTRVIAICNQKGGVGKTTTAMNLSAYLAMLGYHTLLIDFDPQFNATVGLGVQHAPDETIYHALLAGQIPERAIRPTHLANLHLAPASGDLAGALVELVNLPRREYYLRDFVEKVSTWYDFVLIDLPPSVNLLTVNGLIAAGEVIIPVQCEYYSLEGLGQLLHTIDLIRTNMRHPLQIGGALLTMYDKREKLSREVAREVRRRFPHHVYDVEIPRSVSLAEAPSFQKPVALHAPQSSGAFAYERLAREVVMQFVNPSTQVPSGQMMNMSRTEPRPEPREPLSRASEKEVTFVERKEEAFREAQPTETTIIIEEIDELPPFILFSSDSERSQ